MNGSRRRSVLVGLTAAVLLVAAIAGPASARWSVHDSFGTVTEINPPPGSTEWQICADQLRGRTGWMGAVAEGQDPATFPIPERAFDAIPYEVFTQASGSFEQIATFTPPPRAQEPTPIPMDDPRAFVFTTARFSVPLTGVEPGEEVMVKPFPGDPGPVAIRLTAVDCGDTGFLSDWEGDVGFCRTAGTRLLTGDFDGDGRADLLCHDPATGGKAVALARAGGQFAGTDWEGTLGLCRRSGTRLLVGDVNADGRDDLLCHDPATGGKWVALARTGGRFVKTDWHGTLGLCRSAGTQLVLGDLNGDLRDDLLCHDPTTGGKAVALARAGGRFTRTDWHGTLGLCRATGTQLHLGDVSGDARADLVCHDPATGHLWIALARAGGRFTGTDWQRNMGFCSTPGARAYVADYSGDGRSDLLCHDRGTGYAWAAYSDL
jgi:VCBS repeat protein